MALQSSGPISNNDIAGEFGGSTPHSLSEYYRNGGLVPGNNTNIPTSGTIRLSDFYGAVNEIIVNISASATDVNANTLFGTNWGSSVPKRLIINSGVTVGGVSAAALTLNGSMGGTLVVENNGSIQGFGGTSNGGNGGNAIQADQTASVTITNNSGGQIYAGGGGGGQGGSGGSGGTGGQGGTGGGGQTSSEPGGTGTLAFASSCNGRCEAVYGSGAICVGQCQFQNLSMFGLPNKFACSNCRTFSNTSGGAGGAGGAGSTSGGTGGTGGRGRGYNQTQQNGSSGSAGPSGSAGSSGSSGGSGAGTGGTGGTGGSGGTGGTGGNGGDWGTNGTGGSTGSTGATGNTGATGANGNRTNGSAGSSGSSGSSGSGGSGAGSAGIYITNRSSLTFTNNGAVAGV